MIGSRYLHASELVGDSGMHADAAQFPEANWRHHVEI
jgi:hypothetical protein